MEPIREGMSGAAVGDIQDRLTSLGYEIDQHEVETSTFGRSTARAVARFRLEHGIDLDQQVDTECWAALVDETYQLGDRTLYLRLPNYHGRDVRDLQTRLNILGFSCGEPDGYYGVHTEAAVKQFQETVGLLGDGMAFQDTFDAIDRLQHVWAGKPAKGPHPMGGMGFARAASVLEETKLAICGEDPIARNVAARVWNLAGATTEHSGLDLVRSADVAASDCRCVLVISSARPKRRRGITVSASDPDTLPLRLRAAIHSARRKVPVVRIELPVEVDSDGTFTVGDSQSYAVMLLDAICSAFGD